MQPQYLITYQVSPIVALGVSSSSTESFLLLPFFPLTFLVFFDVSQDALSSYLKQNINYKYII